MKRHEVNRVYQDIFCNWLDMLNFDTYGHHKHFNYDEKLSGYKIGSIIIRPFNWNFNMTRPNFENRETGLKIWWYKYPLRAAISNIKFRNKNHFLKLAGMRGI